MAIPQRRRWPDLEVSTRRDAILDLLTDFGIPGLEAEQWCRAWEARAHAEGRHPEASDYWLGAAMWILVQLNADIVQGEPLGATRADEPS